MNKAIGNWKKTAVNKKMPRVIQAALFYSQLLARDLGLFGAHLNYCRFIILGRGRSGSNFLRSLLNSHSQILVFGELFRFYDSIGWEFPDYDQCLQHRRVLSLIQQDPGRFLQEQVFRNGPKGISAVGFKIFYYHAQEDCRKAVWPYLKGQRDLKVIHLKRNNTLRMFLSEIKAFQTNRWTNINGEKEESDPVSLNYEDCLGRFILAEEEKKQFDAYFSNHQKIDVYYENLADDYEREMKRVQQFLGVNHEIVRPSTYKQSNQALSQAIANYFELKERFKGTRWEEFFED